MAKPSWGMSRSRNVRMKPSRQAALSSSDAARKARGKPPRTRQRTPMLDPHFSQIERIQLDEFDTASQGLRYILDDVGRCAAQDEKARPILRAINHDPQGSKQLRQHLDFVNDHEAVE